jgi:MSHA biogenesis protein MshL
MAKRIVTCTIAALLTGCMQPMKQSAVHLPSAPTPAASAPAPSAGIPTPVQMTAALPKPSAANRQETYSVVVNGVRVHDLLFALARDAKVNVDIHPGIAGSVTLNAIEQTLPQLLSRIGKQVDMRWELDGPNLAIMPDSPFLRIYKVDYVNMERQATGTITVSAQIAGSQGGAGASGGGGGGGSAGANTSSVTIRNTSNNKFWETLTKNIEELLRETDKVMPTGSSQPMQGGAPASAGTAAAGGGTSTQAMLFREAASVIVNAEAGILSIRATARQHERIQEFLDQVLVSARRQVLIEATIVEVQLSNQYQQGIDWSYLGRGMPSGFRFFQAATGATTATPNASILTTNYNTNTINATIKLLESFGTTRVLSSPRLSVINNQTAMLKVVENLVYFTITSNTNQTANTSSTTFTSTPHVVPVGFVMNITPQISDTDNITLNLKPTISRIAAYVEDPNPVLRNPCLAAGGAGIGAGNCNIPPIVSRIPQVQTREMESLIRVTNGQIAVMGGLIQDQVSNNEDSIPLINRIPVLGYLFGNHNKQNAKSELVVFLRPVVVKDASIETDYRAYRVLLPDENFLSQPNPGKGTN